MKIILDVNVILSALIKDSTTRKIILESGLDFYFPEPSLHKIRKYEELVLQKFDMPRDVYLEVLTILFKHIKLIPTEEILKHWGEGKDYGSH